MSLLKLWRGWRCQKDPVFVRPKSPDHIIHINPISSLLQHLTPNPVFQHQSIHMSSNRILPQNLRVPCYPPQYPPCHKSLPILIIVANANICLLSFLYAISTLYASPSGIASEDSSPPCLYLPTHLQNKDLNLRVRAGIPTCLRQQTFWFSGPDSLVLQHRMRNLPFRRLIRPVTPLKPTGW